VCLRLQTVRVLAKYASRVVGEGGRATLWTRGPLTCFESQCGVDGPDLTRRHRKQLHPGRAFEREREHAGFLHAARRDQQPVSGAAAGHQMMAFVLNPTEKGTAAHPMSHHSGEELLFVLSGSIKLRLARREEILEAGDSAHFNSVIPHKITCMKESRAQVLIVILPDGNDGPVASSKKAKGR